jgi:O-antigen/teichoic acid export membrane protein
VTERFQGWLRKVLGLSVPVDVHRGVIALADQGVASATNFLTGVVIGRACSKEEFGLYLLGLSIVLFAMRLQTALIATPYMVYSPRMSGSDDARYTGSTLVHQVGISLVATSSLVLAEVAIASGVGPQSLLPVIRALICTIGLNLLRDYARHVCFARLRFAAAFILDASASCVQLACLLFLASKGLLTAESTFWAIGLACGLGSLIWLAQARGTVAISLRQSIADLKGNWSFGKWIFASGFLWELTVNLYPWILTSFQGTTATGVWAACFGAAAIGNPVILGMGNYLGPKMAHSYAEGGYSALRRVVLKSGVIFSLMIFPFSLMLFFWGGDFVVLLYGEKYAGQSSVVLLLALDLLISPIRFGLSRALLSVDRAYADFVTNIFPLLVLMSIGIWLVKTLGPAGVAIGVLSGNIVVVIAKYCAYNRAAPQHVLEYRR